MEVVKPPPLVLLLVWLASALAHVEEPTNVTLRCHNLRNTLEWSYGLLLPKLRFRVEIHPYEGPANVLWVDPPALQADLSFLSNPDGEYLLFVAAVIGQNESEAVPLDGITFSYFMDSRTAKKCSVDLPPVNITAQPDDMVAFSFEHPWLWYRPLLQSSSKTRLRKKKSHADQLPVFTYAVVVNQKMQHHYSCVKSVCEQKIPVEAAQEKHCLNITGELQKMAVKSPQLFCAMPFQEMEPVQNDYIMYIVVSLTLLTVVAFVLLLVYKKKTRPGRASPKSMEINNAMQESQEPVCEVYDVARVEEPSSPSWLLSYREKNEEEATWPRVDGLSDLRMPIGVTNEEDTLDAVEAEPPNDVGAGYMEGSGNLDADATSNHREAPSSGYEKREMVDMGQNEMAEGYHF